MLIGSPTPYGMLRAALSSAAHHHIRASGGCTVGPLGLIRFFEWICIPLTYTLVWYLKMIRGRRPQHILVENQGVDEVAAYEVVSEEVKKLPELKKRWVYATLHSWDCVCTCCHLNILYAWIGQCFCYWNGIMVDIAILLHVAMGIVEQI